MDMVEIRDIRPLGPIWHKRPNEKVEKSEDKPSSGQQHPDKDTGKDDDGSPHVDEYA
jgi:hypothetical protein